MAARAYHDRRNLLWDITMSSPGSVAARVNAMRKAGYGQLDAAFVDADPQLARRHVESRHRKGEEDFREKGEGDGGRYVPLKGLERQSSVSRVG